MLTPTRHCAFWTDPTTTFRHLIQGVSVVTFVGKRFGKPLIHHSQPFQPPFLNDMFSLFERCTLCDLLIFRKHTAVIAEVVHERVQHD